MKSGCKNKSLLRRANYQNREIEIKNLLKFAEHVRISGTKLVEDEKKCYNYSENICQTALKSFFGCENLKIDLDVNM